ncbi:32468_t:CDS:1 [Gigaspora margarita]|uniref:32468_t:CDS:1 n=1 Tax=Gigaspora margarita TaxID=4874 RepID=A0ABN7VKH1_GIGMA|nr:32468_t:CDS:1 [Gigaspora margarita]
MECSSIDYQKRIECLLDRTRPTTASQNKTNDHVNTDKSEKQEKMETTNSLVKADPEDKALKKTLIKEAQKYENKRLKNEHKKNISNNHKITNDLEELLGDSETYLSLDLATEIESEL